MPKSKAESTVIQIVNPREDGRKTTNLARARRYVRQGKAEWMDGKLAFLDIEARGSGVRAMQRAIFDVRPFPKDYTYRMGRAMLQPCQVSDPLPWQKWAMA